MGFDAGYQEGLTLGRGDAAQRVAGLAQALEAAAAEFRQREAIGIDTVAREAVDLALTIAEAIVGRDVAASEHPGRDGLIRALALAPATGDITARLNPSDLSSLGDLSSITGGREVSLIGDPLVESGGCVLQAGATRIDTQISKALERVRAELLSEELLGEQASHDAERAGLIESSDRGGVL